MDLSLDDTATSCDSLRTRYKRAVTDLLRSLKSDPKLNYSSNDLMELNVNLGMFNPEDPDFVASHVCLFKPIPSDEFEKFTFNLSKASRDTRGSHDEYDKRYFEISEDVTEGRCQPDREEVFAMSQDAERTAQYLNIRYEYSRTKTSRFKTLAIISGWTQMDIENSFSKLPEGFLSGFQRCQQIPDWDIRADYEWQDKKTIYPHVMLVMRSGAVAVEGKLFLGELGSIAQVIKNRLAQKEFVTTSLFPVLVIALYGPRNGRLIQARYDKSGVLKVRASPIYSFAEREKAPWDLFLRYHTSKPCDGPEIELGYDQVESEYVPIETESCRGIDVLAREPKHVPKNGLEPHQANKENIPPGNDEEWQADEQ